MSIEKEYNEKNLLNEMPASDTAAEVYKTMEHDLGDAAAEAVGAHIDAREVLEGIEDAVVDTYKSIEDGVVGTYQKIEDKFVDSFQKIEDRFVEKVLAKPGESIEDAKKRVAGEITQL